MVNVELDDEELNRLLELLEYDVEYGRSILTTRLNLRIYDKLYNSRVIHIKKD